jgi:hypothetical protein
LKGKQADPATEPKQFISVGSSGWRRGFRRLAQDGDYIPELRFAVIQDFRARIEKRFGDLLQFGFAGLATLCECHVQSVLSNL